MEKLNFESPKEMYNVIKNGFDVYNLQTEEYVYVQNDRNDFFIGHINNNEAEELAKEAKEMDEYWGANLYKGEITNGYRDTINYCNQVYNKGTWVLADNSYLDKQNINEPEHIVILKNQNGWIKKYKQTFAPTEEKSGYYKKTEIINTFNAQEAMQMTMTKYCATIDSLDRQIYKIQRFEMKQNARARKPGQISNKNHVSKAITKER